MSFYSVLCVLFVAWCCLFAISSQRSIPADVCVTTQCLHSAQILKRSVNMSVDPCDNFYKFACGNWLSNHPTGSEFVPVSTFELRGLKNTRELRDFLERKNDAAEPDAVHKARKLFALCMDTDKLDRQGMQPLKNILDKIGISLQPSKELDFIETFVKMSRLVSIDPFFNVGVSSNPYNQTENKITITRPIQEGLPRVPIVSLFESNNGIETLSKDEYLMEVVKVLCDISKNRTECHSLYDSPESSWTTEQKRLKEYKESRSDVVLKAYPKEDDSCLPKLYTLKYLQNLTNDIARLHSKPALNWTRSIEMIFDKAQEKTLDLSKPEEVDIVMEAAFITDVLQFIYSRNDSEHEIGMVWEVAHNLANYLSHEIRDLKVNFTSDLTGSSSRGDWCTTDVSQLLGMATSYYYATNETYKSVKEDVTNLVSDIQKVYQDIIISSSWIDEKTKMIALKKLKTMKKLIAYPYSLSDRKDLDTFYKDLKVTDDFMETVLNLARQKTLEELQTLNKINDLEEDRRIVTPIEVNAFYDTERNAIIIPAGILGDPIYGHGLQSLNYGIVGHILGHEITHGYDSLGRRFNYLGNLEEWWQPETLLKFNEKSKCFIENYSNYSENIDELNFATNGSVTLAENIADNGGFKEALGAYRNYVFRNGEEKPLKDYENFTSEQLFTIAFANLWCENPFQLSEAMAPSRDHSPNVIRVNGVAKNSAEFSKIWNCPESSNMNPKTEKCTLW